MFGVNLFSAIEARDYFANLRNRMKDEVETLSDSQILSIDLQELSNYLISKYTIIPITVFEKNIEKTLSETKVRKPNPFRGDSFEKDYFEVDGVCVTYKIPFDGNSTLFNVKPTTYIMSNLTVATLIEPEGDNCGSFMLHLEFTKEELLEKS